MLLGTAGGSPYWTNSDRAGIASAVVVGDRYYLVDAGREVVRQLRAAGLGDHASDTGGPLDALRAVFLTHLHSDHVVDLNNVLSAGLYNGLARADRPVPIFGPGNRGAVPPLFGDRPAPPVTAPANPTPGTAEMIDLMVATFATDYNDRAFDGGSPDPGRAVPRVRRAHPRPVPGGPERDPHPRMSPVPFHEDDRVRVSATLVQHAPMFPALAYRFDTDAGSVVFSGDTGPSENLVELARGADVLVHEVIDTDWVDQLLPPPRTPAQEGLFRHLLGAHTAVAQVAPSPAPPRSVRSCCSHLVPGQLAQERWDRARGDFAGRFIVGQDLTVVDIGPASHDHVRERRSRRTRCPTWCGSTSSTRARAPARWQVRRAGRADAAGLTSRPASPSPPTPTGRLWAVAGAAAGAARGLPPDDPAGRRASSAAMRGARRGRPAARRGARRGGRAPTPTLCRRCGTADVPVAVRSSAVGEDAPDASFAGEHDTYLWVRGAAEVLARGAAVLGEPVHRAGASPTGGGSPAAYAGPGRPGDGRRRPADGARRRSRASPSPSTR